MRIKDYDLANNIHDNDVLIIDGPEGTRTVKKEQVIPGIYEAEAWANGTMDGVPVPEQHRAYHNNAKYHAQNAANSATAANSSKVAAATSEANASTSATNAATSEANAATSELNASQSETNAAESAATASTSESNALVSATNANRDALKSEGHAIGKQNGVDVSSDSPYFQNNAKYYAELAEQYAQGGLIYKGSILFANIPTTGISIGDMYNIEDDFTTDSRFQEGAGIKVKAGTNIAWNSSKWDLLAIGAGGHVVVNESGTELPQRSKLQFEGAIVSDDETNDATVVETVNPVDYEEDIYGVNLLNLTATTQTINGVTFTVNESAGTITANGTATANVDFQCVKNAQIKNILKVGESYIFTTALQGGATGNITLRYNENGTTKYVAFNTGVFTATQAMIDNGVITWWVNSGQAISNVVSKLMLRKATIKDDTYRPYNQQSIQHQLTDQTNVLGAKNLIPYPYTHTTRTVSGVTMTDNGDGSVTLNGTATAQCYFSFVTGAKIPCKKQILGQKVISTIQYTSTSQNGKWSMFCDTSRNGTDSKFFSVHPTSNANDKVSASGFITTVDDGNDFIELNINMGFTATNLRIYPMLRLASDPDDTYVPYAMTNRELTEKTQEIEGTIGNTAIPSGLGTTVTGALSNIDSHNHYSTSETWTGKYWIDGKKIYFKTFYGTLSSGSGHYSFAHNISSISECLDKTGYVKDGTAWVPYGFFHKGSSRDVYYYVSCYVMSNNIVLECSNDYGGKNFKITIFYTKTTD